LHRFREVFKTGRPTLFGEIEIDRNAKEGKKRLERGIEWLYSRIKAQAWLKMK